MQILETPLKSKLKRAQIAGILIVKQGFIGKAVTFLGSHQDSRTVAGASRFFAQYIYADGVAIIAFPIHHN